MITRKMIITTKVGNNFCFILYAIVNRFGLDSEFETVNSNLSRLQWWRLTAFKSFAFVYHHDLHPPLSNLYFSNIRQHCQWQDTIRFHTLGLFQRLDPLCIPLTFGGYSLVGGGGGGGSIRSMDANKEYTVMELEFESPLSFVTKSMTWYILLLSYLFFLNFFLSSISPLPILTLSIRVPNIVVLTRKTIITTSTEVHRIST